jgi:hypothetical protein
VQLTLITFPISMTRDSPTKVITRRLANSYTSARHSLRRHVPNTRQRTYSRPSHSGGLPYPHEEARQSTKKQLANNLVMSAFEAQGLGRTRTLANILVLDTPDLRTVRTLLGKHARYIRQIIIVEKDPDIKCTITRNVEHAGLNHIVSVMQGEVIEFLAGDHNVHIGYVWLDAMAAYLDRDGILPAVVSKLATRCLTLTFSKRLRKGDTHHKYTARIANSLRELLPYKVIDWGYSISTGTQSMQLVAFGAAPASCACSAPPMAGGPEYVWVAPDSLLTK